jgi:hypothetical protein
MANFARNWWRKHDMDKDGKGCALIAMFGCLAAVVAGAVLTIGAVAILFYTM